MGFGVLDKNTVSVLGMLSFASPSDLNWSVSLVHEVPLQRKHNYPMLAPASSFCEFLKLSFLASILRCYLVSLAQVLLSFPDAEAFSCQRACQGGVSALCPIMSEGINGKRRKVVNRLERFN